MELVANLRFVLLVSTILANLVLAFLVYRNNSSSITNRIYAYLSISISIWLVSYHVSLLELSPASKLLWVRLSIFFATPMSFLFYFFSTILPNESITTNKRTLRIFVILTLATMAINISPYAFTSIETTSGSAYPVAGPGILPFAALSTFFSFATIFVLIKKLRSLQGIEKTQTKYVTYGVSLMLLLIISTIFIPSVFFQNSNFVPFFPLYTLLFLAPTAYSIFRLHFLNVKVISTQVFIFALWIALLFAALSSDSLGKIILNYSIFIATVILGVFLIRSVLDEIKTREEIQRLAENLRTANEELRQLDAAKSEFVSIASHQLRTPLSIIKGYLSMAREGSFGKISRTLTKPLNRIYLSNERLIKLVNDLLDLSRMESGHMQYLFDYFDFEDFINSMVEEFKLPASDKNIRVTWNVPKETFRVWGDSQKLRQVVFNIIDNALKYTNEGGHIEIILKKADDEVNLVIKDSGIGMSRETMEKLFKKFARGEKVPKINTEGAGLGLYVAKRIIEDHRGEIWAESQGEGLGSNFHLKLPIKNPEESSENKM